MWFKVLEYPPKPDVLKEVSLNGVELVLTNVKDKLYCFENRCPHEEVKLSLGCVKNEKIKCALHGYSFNLATGWSSEEDLDRLKTYKVKREKAGVYIKIEDY
tara:strand:- start:224 stop:529 length:306 start_codon:yes stop_codon:yes gene_type:complete